MINLSGDLADGVMLYAACFEGFNLGDPDGGAVPNHFYRELNFPEFFITKPGATKVLWEAREPTMEEIRHIGFFLSRDNGCPYCTAAFCTILNHGLDTPEDYIADLLFRGAEATGESRLRLILDYALQVNRDAAAVRDGDVQALRDIGLTDKGIVQLTQLVSDFTSYNRLKLALDTDFDYRAVWKTLAGFDA